jgi:hypothetical protein
MQVDIFPEGSIAGEILEDVFQVLNLTAENDRLTTNHNSHI